jgi:hypothetical protein
MLRHAQRVCLTLAVLTSSLLASTPRKKENAATVKITAELQRLQKLASEQKSGEAEWKDLEPAVKRVLTRADEGLRTGRIYAAIDDLAKARTYLEAYVTTKVSAEASAMPAFEDAWKRTSVELVALDRAAQKRMWNGKPIVQQALSESAQGQTLTMVEASRAYATVTDTHAGYYYIGEAKTDAAIATFVYTLPLPMAGTRFGVRSWLPELQALQEKVNAEFVPPKSIDHHTDFIRLNSTIKLASELDSAKLYAGALYQYLSAVQQFASMDAGELDQAKQSALKNQLEQWKMRLQQSKRDNSLAELFVERAELWTNHADGTPVNADQWKAAWGVVSAALPAYEAALSAVPQTEQKAPRLVTVTLVRWPYT